MPHIQWDESYSVGVPELDVQHTRWITLINTLHDVLMGRRNSSEFSVLACLEAMLEYTNYHLRFEEQLLVRAGYPLLEEHKMEHEKFQQQINTYLSAERDGNTMLNSEVMDVLMGWLKNHILQSDMAYKDFFEQQG